MARQVPGAVSLGLLAAFLGHAMVYGGGHVMGGSYAEMLRLVATLATLAAGIAWLATTWACGAHICDGTVIAARMDRLLPSTSAVVAAAIAWFTLAESIEGSHPDAPTFVLALALLAASLLVAKVAKIAMRAVAEIVFGTRSRRFAPRVPIWTPLAPCPAFVAPVALERHLFARPPPIDLRA